MDRGDIMPSLSKQELSLLLPHAGDMCLLDSVERWDASSIRCVARSHRDRENPLGGGGRLEAICGLEYAAQTMAVHAGLVRARGQPQPAVGYLGGVRDLKLGVQRLDDIQGDLEIEASRLIGSDSSLMYSFLVAARGTELLRGRASIFFQYDNRGS